MGFCLSDGTFIRENVPAQQFPIIVLTREPWFNRGRVQWRSLFLILLMILVIP